MNIDILTLFPEMFQALNASIIGKAQTKKLVNIKITNFRDFTDDKHHHVDDYPFGGGAGMVLKLQPIKAALAAIKKHRQQQHLPMGKIILLTPSGKKFTQKAATKLAQEPHVTFICGHYEDVDARVDDLITDKYSIGDYVLTGGELPAMVMIDAMVRFVPGVLGNQSSIETESFAPKTGILDYPHYTRPAISDGKRVPSVLLNGNHQKIASWRAEQALRLTYKLRPDLLAQATLSLAQKRLLNHLKTEKNDVNL